MKKIVNGKELQEKILESVHLLCGVVKETLGPKGGNVLIDHSTFSPFITNDGVTIAKNIESDDETIGAILEIIKEASIKTNDQVGDGTTTTLVLLESLYSKSLELVKNGTNPILIKKQLDMTLEEILSELDKLKKKATSFYLKNIACIASGDEKLGNIAYQAIKKVKYIDAVTIKEVNETRNRISFLKGYFCGINLLSSYIFKEENLLNYKDAYVLVMNNTLTNIENISFLLNDILKCKKQLIIFSDNFLDDVISYLTSISLSEDVSICLLKIEEYGKNVYEIMKDICCITGARIVTDEDNITFDDIGFSESGLITNDSIRFDFNLTNEINKYLNMLKKDLKMLSNDLEKDFLVKRIAMFSNGIAEIEVGSPTKTEGIEKRMRLEDALCAVVAANHGVLLGSGISFLQIADKISLRTDVSQVWKDSLKEPFQQIFYNAGLDSQEYKRKIEDADYKSIYNISSNDWEESNKTKVIDPYLVLKQILINATSIAGMLLTTGSLIINEYKDSLNKNDEYSIL